MLARPLPISLSRKPPIFRVTLLTTLFCLSPLLAQTKLTQKETALLGTSRGWRLAVRLLKERLQADDFRERSLQLLSNRRVHYDSDAVIEKIIDIARPSGRGGYVLTSEAVLKAEQFLSKHSSAFSRAEHEFGVPSRMVASLLWVETKYGKNVGTYKALNVLISLALLSVPEFGRGVAKRVYQKEVKPEWKVGEFAELSYWEKRAVENIGERWYKELKAFLEISVGLRDVIQSKTKYRSTHAIPGSHTGALGIGQFQPATLKPFLQNEDGTLREVNLWNYDDMIQLISRKLRDDGWTPTANDAGKKDAIFAYNNSNKYVAAIWGLYRCLISYDQNVCDKIIAESRSENEPK